MGLPARRRRLAAADKNLGDHRKGAAGTARVIVKATRGLHVSCHYQLVAASGTGLREGLEALKTSPGSQD